MNAPLTIELKQDVKTGRYAAKCPLCARVINDRVTGQGTVDAVIDHLNRWHSQCAWASNA